MALPEGPLSTLPETYDGNWYSSVAPNSAEAAAGSIPWNFKVTARVKTSWHHISSQPKVTPSQSFL